MPPKSLNILDELDDSTQEWAPSNEGSGHPLGEPTRNRPLEPNLLFLGENSSVMATLRKALPERINLVYIDPPFATGHAWHYRPEANSASKKPGSARGAVQTHAYGDAWGSGPDTYLAWMKERLEEIHALLHPEGSLLLHCDHRASPYLSIICDEIFGPGDRRSGPPRPGFRNEIVWAYGLGGSSPRCYPKKHDTILWYTKGTQWTFNPPMVPATSAKMRGELKKAPDTWMIPTLNNMARERTGYPTQKPLQLLERIVEAHSNPGDLVADFFSGSGTTLEAAEKKGRQWIGCDATPMAVHVAKKRLLDLGHRQSFRVVDLSPYEGRLWYASNFVAKGKQASSEQHYRKHILKAYEATKIGTSGSFHGTKSNSLVWVAPFDHRISSSDLDRIEESIVEQGQKSVHILGWQWDLDDPLDCNKRSVDFALIQIPRSLIAHGSGEDTPHLFLERPRVELKMEKTGGLGLSLKLQKLWHAHPTMLPIPTSEHPDGPLELLDQWAVDWNHDGSTFQYAWVSGRSRKIQTMEFCTSEHIFPGPGPHRIAVKVVDAFGTSMTQTLRVEFA